ncbi:hypothetical protein BX616_005738, partial [Lobosporangium transversale]
QTENILENAYRIRLLAVDTYTADYFLEDALSMSTTTVTAGATTPMISPIADETMSYSKTPTQLRELHCKNYFGYNTRQSPLTPKSNALNLIEFNPKLERLVIQSEITWRNSGQQGQTCTLLTDRVLMSLSQHQALTRIDMTGCWIGHEECIQLILHCPKALQDFACPGVRSRYSSGWGASESSPSMALANRKLPFLLHQLRFCSEMNSYEEAILFPLLRSSPGLLEFNVPELAFGKVYEMVEIIRLTCRKLRALRINNRELSYMTNLAGLWAGSAVRLLYSSKPYEDTLVEGGEEEGGGQLDKDEVVAEEGEMALGGADRTPSFRLYHSPIRELGLGLMLDVHNILIKAIIGSCISTSEPDHISTSPCGDIKCTHSCKPISKLQTLRLTCCAEHSSTLPAWILARCPDLKELSLRSGISIDESWNITWKGVDLRTMAEQPNWVCHGLEVLEMDIGIAREDMVNSARGNLELIRLIRGLYRKLRMLKSLRVLKLQWIRPSWFQSLSEEYVLEIMNNNDGWAIDWSEAPSLQASRQWGKQKRQLSSGLGLKCTKQDLKWLGFEFQSSAVLRMLEVAKKEPRPTETLDDVGEDGEAYEGEEDEGHKEYGYWRPMVDWWYYCERDENGVIDDLLDEPWYRQRKHY